MSATGTVLMMQGGLPVPAPASTLPVAQPTDIASLASLLMGLTQRVAALEGRADPCVALSGTIQPATLQIGQTVVLVSVAGLLASDIVVCEPVSDLPAGLAISWAHPRGPGSLAIALSTGVAIAISAPITLAIRALR